MEGDLWLQLWQKAHFL